MVVLSYYLCLCLGLHVVEKCISSTFSDFKSREDWIFSSAWM